MNLKLHFRLFLIAAILAGLAGGLAVSPAAAAVIIVNTTEDTITSDGNCSLREAITNANNNARTYTDCEAGTGADVINFATGGFLITLGSVLPHITDAAGLVINYGAISGNGSVQAFIVDGGASLILENALIRDGYDVAEGGAIENHGSLTIIHSTFSYNIAAQGGAIFNWNDAGALLTVTDSTFVSNTASIMGGAIQNNYGGLNVNSSTFSYNTAPKGAGIYTLGDEGNALVVSNSTFTSNSASDSGGGIFTDGPLTVTNSTFSGNSVLSGGGAIHNHDGVATTVLKNTIVADSTGGANCSGSLTNGGNNIDSSTSCGFGSANGSISSTNPNLGALTGTPAYIPLNSPSPAIDGVTWSAPNSCPPFDQRGYGRPVDGDANGSALCDIGSFEYEATFVSNITRVSVENDGTQANNDSIRPSISADGRYVAFETSASLVAGDTNENTDVYLRDTVAHTTIPVSVDQSGHPAGGWSASISADGRYVAFMTTTSLASADTNGFSDIYVRDVVQNTTTLVSTNTAGTVGDFYSYGPVISADGLHVAFCSYSTNLVDSDLNEKWDIFVHDLTPAHTTRLVSLREDGLQGGNGDSSSPAISSDGHYVAFLSQASDLVTGDTNGVGDIFLRDMVGNTTTRLSVSSNRVQANDSSYEGVSISADGRYVAFVSTATNLVSGSTGNGDVYLRDTQAGTTTLVSVGPDGNVVGGGLGYPSISANGRYVAFETGANLVVEDTNGNLDIYLKDTQTGAVTLLSTDSYGVQANGSSEYPSISADASTVAFDSYASNLVNGDTNGVVDVFVVPTPPQPPAAFNKISPANSTTDMAINPILSWGTSSGATSYEYCYATTTGCTSWVSVGTVTSVGISGLSHNQKYYWQVRAVNAGGNTLADTGTYWSFTTADLPPSFTTFLPLVPR